MDLHAELACKQWVKANARLLFCTEAVTPHTALAKACCSGDSPARQVAADPLVFTGSVVEAAITARLRLPLTMSLGAVYLL